LAAERGHVAVVIMLLKRHNIDVNAVDVTGCTHLSRAAAMGCPDAVRMLVQHPGTNLNVQDRDGYTALAWAASRGHGLVIIYVLMEQREIDKVLMTTHGWSPLVFALLRGIGIM
jgi:ankyrin repeat protein